MVDPHGPHFLGDGTPNVAPHRAARAEHSAQAARSARAALRVFKTRRAPSLSCTLRGPKAYLGPRAALSLRFVGVS
ncbi:hypothetical protein NDU88_003281 [Pleurodeles waltl]|uniref:Uncharacterized protein n=1 Tax=Pleurodeles waltl TaxID=8319 RepID=A0AAV7W4J4_PLEWA|nr:hypothetical protein NDU88_003281 [Pleurodeles waltl]